MLFFFLFVFGELDLLWVRRETGYRNFSFLRSRAQVTSLTPFVLNTIFRHYLDEMFFFSDLWVRSSTKTMAAKLTVYITLLFVLSFIFNRVLAQQCTKGGSESSIFGWKLQGHVYTTTMANFGFECVLICRQDKRCQSFNWVISTNMCEFSDRTKEARPEDFVPDPDRFYYKRGMNRGKLNSHVGVGKRSHTARKKVPCHYTITVFIFCILM